MDAKTLLSAVFVVVVVSSGAVAAAGIMRDPTAEQYPITYYQEGQLTVTTNEMREVDLLDWKNDYREIVQLDAHSKWPSKCIGACTGPSQRATN